MKALAIALTLAAANPANAQVMWQAEPVPGWNNTIPPPRFQGPGPAAAMYVMESDINKWCWKDAAGPKDATIYACFREVNMPDGSIIKVMILPLPCPYAYRGEVYAKLVCHEFGHTQRNWKHEAE